jgi:hypothetical protein
MSEKTFDRWIFVAYNLKSTARVSVLPSSGSGLRTIYYSEAQRQQIHYLIAVIYNAEVSAAELDGLMQSTADDPVLFFFHIDQLPTVKRHLQGYTRKTLSLAGGKKLPLPNSDIRQLIAGRADMALKPTQIEALTVYQLQEEMLVADKSSPLYTYIWSEPSNKRLLFHLAIAGNAGIARTDLEKRVTVRFGNNVMSKAEELIDQGYVVQDKNGNYALEAGTRDSIETFISEELCIEPPNYNGIVSQITSYFSDLDVIYRKTFGLFQGIVPTGLTVEDDLMKGVRQFLVNDKEIVVFVTTTANDQLLGKEIQASMFNRDNASNYIPVLVAPSFSSTFMAETQKFRRVYLLDNVSLLGLECSLHEISDEARNKLRSNIPRIFTQQPKAGLWDVKNNIKFVTS